LRKIRLGGKETLLRPHVPLGSISINHDDDDDDTVSPAVRQKPQALLLLDFYLRPPVHVTLLRILYNLLFY